jgi:hypothetical protein
MGVTSRNISSNHSDMGSPPDRSVCYQFELQTGDICLSNPRPESLGSGCNDHLLERDVQLYLPTISSSPQDFTQDKRGWLQDHSYSSGLAKTILVPGSPTIMVCKTASSSLERGPFVSIQGKEASSRPGETPSASMVAVRTSIRQRGFSEKATKRISGAVRQLTRAIYDSKWSIICSWCLSKEIDPLSITAQQLAEFVMYLFEDKGYTPTIKGYRSAIARTIHLPGGPDFGSDAFLSLMFKNFFIERPKQRRLVPAWELGIVLKALQLSPFEPLNLISFKFLTYRCCFRLALATGRRRSELHALSVSESCIVLRQTSPQLPF